MLTSFSMGGQIDRAVLCLKTLAIREAVIDLSETGHFDVFGRR